jgi:hypothetical protein
MVESAFDNISFYSRIIRGKVYEDEKAVEYLRISEEAQKLGSEEYQHKIQKGYLEKEKTGLQNEVIALTGEEEELKENLDKSKTQSLVVESEIKDRLEDLKKSEQEFLFICSELETQKEETDKAYTKAQTELNTFEKEEKKKGEKRKSFVDSLVQVFKNPEKERSLLEVKRTRTLTAKIEKEDEIDDKVNKLSYNEKKA